MRAGGGGWDYREKRIDEEGLRWREKEKKN